MDRHSRPGGRWRHKLVEKTAPSGLVIVTRLPLRVISQAGRVAQRAGRRDRPEQ